MIWCFEYDAEAEKESYLQRMEKKMGKKREKQKKLFVYAKNFMYQRKIRSGN